MKKLLLLIVLFLFPLIVFAKDICDSNDIKIQSITLNGTRGNIEEVSDASISNQKINLGLKMNVLGDAAEYKIVVKNNSKEDYYFDEKSLNFNMESVNYELLFDNESNLISSGEEKTIILKVSYKEKVDDSLLDNGLYNTNQVVKLNVMSIDNPFTGRLIGMLIFISLIVGFFVLYKDKKRTAYFLLLISLVVPFSVRAVCKYSLEVNTNIVIDGKDAVFLTGSGVNVKMKMLTRDDLPTNGSVLSLDDYLITSFKYSEVEPTDNNKEEKNLVSTPESVYPIYIWFDNGVIYWWSEDKTPALNEDSKSMFYHLRSLQEIDGLETIDTSIVKNMDYFFDGNESLVSIEKLKKWKLSNAESLSRMFRNNSSLVDISALNNWDVSNVKDISYMFRSCISLEVVDFSNWTTSSLQNMFNLFGMWDSNGYGIYNSKLHTILLSDKFNTSKVTNMYALFANNTHIQDYSFLEYFDTSSVVVFSQMFENNKGLKSLNYLKNWNVSNAKEMINTFSGTNITSLNGLENWNVSSLENAEKMFFDNSLLEDASAINDWNITNVTNFNNMFNNVSVHPEFSKREGTWNNGTFIPSN